MYCQIELNKFYERHNLTKYKIIVSVPEGLGILPITLTVTFIFFEMNSILLKAFTVSTVIASSVLGLVGNANAVTNHKSSHKTTIAKTVKQGKTIVETAQATPSLSTLVDAVVATGLVDTLSSKGPFTVFAPDNDAFAKIKVPSDKAVLTKVLTYRQIDSSTTSQWSSTNNSKRPIAESSQEQSRSGPLTLNIR
jgi:uncharacterized surface protein with fasciclin (FAS1) repeats